MKKYKVRAWIDVMQIFEIEIDDNQDFFSQKTKDLITKKAIENLKKNINSSQLKFFVEEYHDITKE